MIGILRCVKQKHVMLRISDNLWACECPHFTGDTIHLKGAIEEAKRLIHLAGGIEQMRLRQKALNKAKRDDRKKRKEERLEVWNRYGYYQPIAWGPPVHE